MGLLQKLHIIPQFTYYMHGTNNDEKREIRPIHLVQDKFADALECKPFENKDWFGHQSQLALFVEELHYGVEKVPRGISQERLFVAIPELAFCAGHNDDRLCLAAVVDVDCHGRESEINWTEMLVNMATFCKETGLQYIWNHSRSGGLHVWFLFTEPVPETDAQAFIRHVNNDFKSYGIFDLTGITQDLRKQIGRDVRPIPGSRIAFPEGYYYKNALFDMGDVKGIDKINVDEYKPTTTPHDVKVWKSPTKKAQTKTKREESDSEKNEIVKNIIRSVIQGQRTVNLQPRSKWREENKHQERTTDSIRAEITSDPRFENFPEIDQVMPCILARMVIGPTQGSKWGMTIYNVSLSCLAIFGTEEQEGIEKALELTTLIMNHPNIDWEGKPQGTDYYRSNGSFNGALRAIQKGTSPSCHSASIEPMMEHCHPELCLTCRGGFQAVATAFEREETEDLPYLFEARLVDDPLPAAGDRIRYISKMFSVDEMKPEKDLLIKWADWEVADVFHFQQALDRAPVSYDFAVLQQALNSLEGQKNGKQIWHSAWRQSILNPIRTPMSMLLHAGEFITRLRATLQKNEITKFDSKKGGGGSILVGLSYDDVIEIYISDTIISDVCSACAKELRNRECDLEETGRRYMKELFNSKEENKLWKVLNEDLESKKALPERHRQSILHEVARIKKERATASAANIIDIDPHRDKPPSKPTNLFRRGGDDEK